MAGADPKPGHTRETFDAVRSLGVLYIGAMAMAMYGMFAGIERRMTSWAHRGQHA
jgi:hypothetical protein